MENMWDYYGYAYGFSDEYTEDIVYAVCESNILTSFCANIIITGVTIKEVYQKILLITKEETSTVSKILLYT